MIKLNKKGQSLIMFIIFLPILLMSFALIIDVGMMYNAKKEGANIEDYFKINEIEIISHKTNRKNNSTCDIINFRIESIFGNLIGYETYDIKIEDC